MDKNQDQSSEGVIIEEFLNSLICGLNKSICVNPVLESRLNPTSGLLLCNSDNMFLNIIPWH